MLESQGPWWYSVWLCFSNTQCFSAWKILYTTCQWIYETVTCQKFMLFGNAKTVDRRMHMFSFVSFSFLYFICKNILLNLCWADFVDHQDWQKCSFSYTSWEEVCEPNSMNITVHFHFSICLLVFASYSFTLSFSLYSQDLRSSVLNAGGSLIQTLL
jgi:hypothetical protein